jgi:4-hydroxy-3-methylbut-2-enyl diphosphate reductase
MQHTLAQTDPDVPELLLAAPRGVCAGVVRAIDTVTAALRKFGAPIYVRHEIVHNRTVVDDLRRRGVVFVDELVEVPDGATVVFSAHGVGRHVKAEAAARPLRVFDATCPLVAKIHVEVAKLAAEGYAILMIGHRGHAEVEGTLGQLAGGIQLVESIEDVATLHVDDPRRVAVVTQTTLSVQDTAQIIAAIRARYPALREPKKSDICYATENRQQAVRWIAPRSQVVIVVGSVSSSNTQRLRELSEGLGTPAYLVDGPDDLRPEWFAGVTRVGLTAGASSPDAVVQRVTDALRALGVRNVRQMPGVDETAEFPLPAGLRMEGAHPPGAVAARLPA